MATDSDSDVEIPLNEVEEADRDEQIRSFRAAENKKDELEAWRVAVLQPWIEERKRNITPYEAAHPIINYPVEVEAGGSSTPAIPAERQMEKKIRTLEATKYALETRRFYYEKNDICGGV